MHVQSHALLMIMWTDGVYYTRHLYINNVLLIMFISTCNKTFSYIDIYSSFYKYMYIVGLYMYKYTRNKTPAHATSH